MSAGQTMEVDIQTPPTDRDVCRINEFFNSSEVKNDLHWFTYRDTLDRAFEREDRRLFYVEQDKEIVGGLMVWCESRVLDDHEAQIRLVAVHPEWRNQGFGSWLCSRAEEFASGHGEDEMIADVAQSSAAVEFWKQCGYEVQEEWQTDGGRKMYRVANPL